MRTSTTAKTMQIRELKIRNVRRIESLTKHVAARMR